MTTTHDPIDIDSAYPLTTAQADTLDQQGFLRVPGLLSPATVAHFESTVTEQVLARNTMHVPMAERDTYNKAFLQVTNLWQHDELVRQLVFSRRVARVAAELLGVRGVRLYHDQALYKEPGGGITPWHADQYYWPFASDRTITVWIPLQETPVELGSLEFAVGSHRFEHGRSLPIGDDSERELQRVVAAQRFGVDTAPYALGDASFHLGWTFHRAGPNRSTIPRRVMTVIYVDADAVVSEPVNDNQREDLRVFLPGARPGHTVPDSEMSHVVYRA